MIRPRCFQSLSVDPTVNLAIEEWLLFHVPEDEIWLYLWQNEHTVVLGKNQNAWFECNIKAFEEDGGSLVRRLSGGGCVYHDLGNLNFTFLVRADNYDAARQTKVLQKALLSFGITAEVSGRNDLTVHGCKVSGNAYYRSGDRRYHHGTLLVNVDPSAMGRYLTPNRLKLSAKGVSSVASRVMNLKDEVPDMTIAALQAALRKAFWEEYQTDRELSESDAADLRDVREALPIPEEELLPLIRKYASDEWTLRSPEPFTYLSAVKRFDEEPFRGLFQLGLTAKDGIIERAVLFTDSLDNTFSERTEAALTGLPYHRESVKRALTGAGLSPLTVLLADLP